MGLFEIMKNEKEIKSNNKILKICLNNGNIRNLERKEEVGILTEMIYLEKLQLNKNLIFLYN